MQMLVTLVILLELFVIAALSGLITDLLRYFNITLELPSTFWLVAISLVLGTVVTLLLGRWIFNPIVRLGNAMQEVAGGNFDVKLEDKHHFREICDIYGNFNRMTKELKATEILQTDFVSNVSHEFKTPIGAIEGYAMLLQGSEQPISQEQAQYIDKILFNTRRLSNLVGNILLLSKVDNQAIVSKQSTYRLDEQIRQSIVMMEPEWEKKEIEFDVDMDRVEYTGNEALMQHVWNNLIGNAIKFDPVGGSVRLRLTQGPEEIVFAVEDNGPGIQPGEETHIFDKFYQSDSSHKEEGNGLGLALVKQILRVSGGSIQVENLPQGGCRFTVRLSCPGRE